jgi:putative SOS response-associated peptidase YedK
MCGRYVKKTPDITIEDDMALQALFEQGHVPRYNIAPSQQAMVITSEEPRHLQKMRWGLVPAWADDMRIGNKMINARAETIDSKPAFRAAFKARRCLVPCDGFYEWKQTPTGKIPLYIHAADGDFMTFAGLWEEWKDAEGKVLRTFAVITTTPNTLMAGIHDRMPVIISPEDRERWLAMGTSRAELLGLLRPCADGVLEAHRVSTRVNSPLNEGEELILPVGEGDGGGFEIGGQGSLF